MPMEPMDLMCNLKQKHERKRNSGGRENGSGPGGHILEGADVKSTALELDRSGLNLEMSKAPTVSELVGNSNITFRPAVGSHAEDAVRFDYDTDVLWKSNRLSKKQRTVSVDSSDSEGMRKISETGMSTSSPIDVPRPRRISFSEMIFGSPAGVFSWGQSNMQGTIDENRRASITEDVRFKQLLKHQNKVLGEN